jgi:hypothetical protein
VSALEDRDRQVTEIEDNDGGWLAVADPKTGNHALPLNDFRDHVESGQCWCRPTLDENVWVHHAMDQREQYEEGRKPS